MYAVKVGSDGTRYLTDPHGVACKDLDQADCGVTAGCTGYTRSGKRLCRKKPQGRQQFVTFADPNECKALWTIVGGATRARIVRRTRATIVTGAERHR